MKKTVATNAIVSIGVGVVVGLFLPLSGAAQPPLSAPEKVAFKKAALENAKQETEKKEEALVRTLIDKDKLRSIEIITDRHESIAQFFKRQKLIFASSPIQDAHSLSTAEQFKSDKPRTVFVSYPIDSDSDFNLKLYGAYFELAPPAPEVIALLRGSDAIQGEALKQGETSLLPRSFLFIFAPEELAEATGLNSKNARKVRLVGRIQTLGLYSFLQEKDLFSFAPKSK